MSRAAVAAGRRMLLFICLAALAIPSHAKSWRITDFHDTVTISQSGKALVTERLNIQFEYESHASKGFRDLKIYIPDAVDSEKVVQIEYAVENGIRYFENYDEFYWNVTGNDWPVPIDHASAFVRLPPNTAGSLRAQAFTGAYGSAGRESTAEVNGADVTFETTAALPMRGGLT